MQTLITGGAGFIGTRLAKRLVTAGHDVLIFDSLHEQVHGATRYVPPSGATFVRGDVSVASHWDALLATHGRPDVVFHLAAETGTGQSLRAASRHAAVNTLGTAELTDALLRNECVPGRIILTSSRAVYGEGAWENEVDGAFYPSARSVVDLEAGVWDPRSPSGRPSEPVAHAAASVWARPVNVYAATKLAQEHLLQSWCPAFDVDLGILRLQNVFGPGQAVGNAYTGVLTFFASRAARGEPLDVYEDGQIIRDFVFVDDVVDALVLCAGATTPQSIVDIGSGEARSLLSVAQMMADIAGTAPPRVTGQFRAGDVRAAFADLTMAGAELGWSPSTSLRAGLEALIGWVRDEIS